MRLLKILVVALLVMCINCSEVLSSCDNCNLQNSSNVNDSKSENNFSRKGITKLLDNPKVLNFSGANVSIECQQASFEYLKSLRNLELWALKSNFSIRKV